MKTITRPLVVVLTAGLLLTGCATPGGPAEPTVTASPAPEVTPPAPEPTQTTSDAVTADGIPPVELGMPFADALDAIGAAPDSNCPEMGFTDQDGSTFWVLRDPGSDEAGPVVLVAASVPADAVTKTGPRTPEGIGIGSTVAEVREAYPDAEEVAGGPDRRYLKVRAVEDGAVFLGYRPGDDVVWEVSVTQLPAPPYESCA